MAPRRPWMAPMLAAGLALASAACSSAPPQAALPTLAALDLGSLIADDLPQQSNAAMALYAQWQNQFVTQGPCASDELYVATLGNAGKPGDITVSEAMGYGLLITALMAAGDPQAQQSFDKMLNFILRRSVDTGLPLMTWRIDASCNAPGNETSATDGELDIALALLYADHLWGSGKTFDYANIAQQRIAAIMTYIVQDQNGTQPILGLWENVDPSGKFYHTFRLSDVMPRHFVTFAAATSDARWLQLYGNAQRMMTLLQQQSPANLVPDFAVVVDHGRKILPVPPMFLERGTDGFYSFNACRVPMRMGKEVLSDVQSPYKQNLSALVNGLRHLSHDDPTQLADGYDLDGAAIGADDDIAAFVTPLAAGIFALDPAGAAAGPFVPATLQTGLNEPYYGATLRMLCAAQSGM